MNTHQISLSLPAFPRGFHLITKIISGKIDQLNSIQTGIAHIFIHHTSASLTINENADPTVRGDFERHFNKMIPENAPYYQHNSEGSDDMPAHLKAALLGTSISIPITSGKMNLGMWQGIYLCEHRNHAQGRDITITLLGN